MSDNKEQFFKSLSLYYDRWYESFADWEGCQSPIEEMMCRALYVLKDQMQGFVTVEPQVNMGPYRVDFFVTLTREYATEGDKTAWYGARVIVECDGHDFHEKTKEQAARDKERDRFLQTVAGHTVLHFTGSEIWKDVFKCATEVVDCLEEKISEERFRK